jgi:hypothetical protein
MTLSKRLAVEWLMFLACAVVGGWYATATGTKDPGEVPVAAMVLGAVAYAAVGIGRVTVASVLRLIR